MDCPHCKQPLFRKSGDKLKARTKILVLHKSNEVEINCIRCGKGVLLPFKVNKSEEVRKATPQRLFVPKP